MRQLKIAQRITTRDSIGLDKYLQDIGRESLLTADEEVDLAKRIKEGDNAALERLTRANLRFVVSVAKQYQNQGLSLQDLINEGNLGLIKAAARFDHTKGFKFISYAVWWIRQAIQTAMIENARLVRLPANKLNTLRKINYSICRLEQELGREPSPSELARFTNLEEKDVKSSLGAQARTLSIDAPIGGDDSDMTLCEVIENEEAGPAGELMKESTRKEINRLLATLSFREAEVLRCYFGISGVEQPMIVEEIGRRLGLSPERIRQIKERALRRLRNSEKNKLLKECIA